MAKSPAPRYRLRSADRPAQHPTGTDARPAQRAESVHTPKRTRRRKDTAQEDMFWLPVEEIPEGSSYEWKRWTAAGLEDPFYIAQMREQGWEPVDPKRHPNWLPPGYNEPNIIKGGQILMERPIELTLEARAEQRQLARRQVIEAEQRLGMTARELSTNANPNDLDALRPKLHKEVGRMTHTVED